MREIMIINNQLTNLKKSKMKTIKKQSKVNFSEDKSISPSHSIAHDSIRTPDVLNYGHGKNHRSHAAWFCLRPFAFMFVLNRGLPIAVSISIKVFSCKHPICMYRLSNSILMFHQAIKVWIRNRPTTTYKSLNNFLLYKWNSRCGAFFGRWLQ